MNPNQFQITGLDKDYLRTIKDPVFYNENSYGPIIIKHKNLS